MPDSPTSLAQDRFTSPAVVAGAFPSVGETVSDLVTFCDAAKVIRRANPAFNDWFNSAGDDLTGRTVAEVLGDSAFASLEPSINTALKGEASGCVIALTDGYQSEHRFRASHVPHTANGKVLGFYLLMHDTTDDKTPAISKTEQQAHLAYVQRMSIMGELACTLAHDLNQPLSAISNYASGLTRMLQSGHSSEDAAPIARKIIEQVEHASLTVRDVRDFVGRHGEGWESLNLNRLLEGAIALTASRARTSNVRIRVSACTPLPAINGDAVQIKQVLINLINNAIDAMRDTDRNQRTLWLTTAVADAQVQLSVTDSGPGIPSDKLKSIFDPLQSTKPDGMGMGMGLTISRSITEWHGGRLWAESQPDCGATFQLRLPMASPDAKL